MVATFSARFSSLALVFRKDDILIITFLIRTFINKEHLIVAFTLICCNNKFGTSFMSDDISVSVGVLCLQLHGKRCSIQLVSHFLFTVVTATRDRRRSRLLPEAHQVSGELTNRWPSSQAPL